MTLSAQVRSVWAKFGYDPESRHWLPLWLHLLDAAAVAEHIHNVSQNAAETASHMKAAVAAVDGMAAQARHLAGLVEKMKQ